MEENLRENLFFDPKNGYDRIDTEERLAIEAYSREYMDFLNSARTEREAVRYAIAAAKKNGFREFKPGLKLQPGDRVWVNNRGKALMLAVIGNEPLDSGAVIAGAHVDAPRLDLKQIPLYEQEELCYLRTHYYGGIKKYQWVTVDREEHTSELQSRI